MENNRQTQQEREKVRKKRRIRNQIIVYIGVVAFVVAVAAATVPGVKHLLQGGQQQEGTQQISQLQGENLLLLESQETEAPWIPDSESTEKINQKLAEMRPAMVSLRGSEDGASYENGTGFIVDIQEDILYICTCGHVIENYDSMEIGFYDGTTVTGVKTGISQVYDVGIVEVGLEQLSEELIQGLLVVKMDTDHWVGLEGKRACAGFISLFQEAGTDSYVTGSLVDILADFPWGDLSHSEFRLSFEKGDSGAAIFDEEGQLISMVMGISYDEESDSSRSWGVPLSGIMTCYMEVINQRGSR